jgi:Phage integrase SAM-like domain
MKSGSVYKRNKSWCISYYARGKRFRETVKDARSKRDAEAKLQQRLASFHANKFVGPAEDKIYYEDLQQIIKDDYTRKKRASLVVLQYHFKHLEPFFRWRRAIDIDVALVEEYQRKRQTEGAQNATINREISSLQRALNLAVKQKRLSQATYF